MRTRQTEGLIMIDIIILIAIIYILYAGTREHLKRRKQMKAYDKDNKEDEGQEYTLEKNVEDR